MDRYSVITNKNQREIVLLKSFPCIWSQCTFCDYITDNSNDEKYIDEVNAGVLEQITGEFGVLEVINSGSCFEIPENTLERIRDIIKEKKIQKLFLESHWCYRERLGEMREFFGIPIIFKIGIETFDNEFRNGFFNKNAEFETPEEVAQYFDSVCLLVGVEGQTKEMIVRDMEILQKHFPYGTVNVFTPNTTNLMRNEELVQWFIIEYQYLQDHPTIEVLYQNTDFGVGD